MKSSRPSLLKRQVVGALAIVALISSACVKQKPPGVAIKNLKADIVFGLNPPVAAPPGVSPPVDLSGLLPDIVAPKFPVSPPRFDIPVCRFATKSDAPEKAVASRIEGTPKVGTYKWKLSGKVKYGGVELPISNQFFTREVRDITPVEITTVPAGGDPPTQAITTKTFSYTLRTTLNPIGISVAAGTQDEVLQVKDGALQTAQQVPPPIPAVGGGGVSKAVVIGDPERGITLKKLVQRDAAGKESVFTPSVGVLLLPIPVNPGETWESVGVDPGSGAVLIHDGFLEKRDFVDACGDLVQAWFVNSRETFIAPGGRAAVAQYEYAFAPQYGGLLAYERFSAPDANNTPLPQLPLPGSPTPNVPSPPTTLPPVPVALPATTDVYEYSLAQLNPTPPG